MVIDAIRAREQTIEGLKGRAATRRRSRIETWGTFLCAVVTANDGMGRLRELLDLFGGLQR